MLGRLRFSVDQAIHQFQLIWIAMGTAMPRYSRVLPMHPSKTSNSSSLDQALVSMLAKRRELYRTEKISDKFVSDPELCKT